MPRQPSRRAAELAFPSGDGASASTARVRDIPQLLPPSDAVSMATARQLRGSTGPRDLPDMEEEPEEEGMTGEEQSFDEEGHDGGISVDGMEGEIEEHEDLDEEMGDDGRFDSAPIPPNLREISSLASWTVSTHKPGCGVAALRNASPSLFWQSDGPQPHTLTLHFFKRVSIVRMRVFLDFELDESYTPTKMVFLAGMGGNDLVEFATWQGETPCGWVDINLEGVGGSYARPQKRKRPERKARIEDDDDDELEDEDQDRNGTGYNDDEDSYEDDIDLDDPSAGNVLKAMVIQVRVCENHQNGKDTHVRGFQVFARDDNYFSRRARRNSTRGHPMKKLSHGRGSFGQDMEDDVALAKFDEDDWLQEPELR